MPTGTYHLLPADVTHRGRAYYLEDCPAWDATFRQRRRDAIHFIQTQLAAAAIQNLVRFEQPRLQPTIQPVDRLLIVLIPAWRRGEIYVRRTARDITHGAVLWQTDHPLLTLSFPRHISLHHRKRRS